MCIRENHVFEKSAYIVAGCRLIWSFCFWAYQSVVMESSDDDIFITQNTFRDSDYDTETTFEACLGLEDDFFNFETAETPSSPHVRPTEFSDISDDELHVEAASVQADQTDQGPTPSFVVQFSDISDDELVAASVEAEKETDQKQFQDVKPRFSIQSDKAIAEKSRRR